MESTFNEVINALKQNKMMAIDDGAAVPVADVKVTHIAELRGKAVMLYQFKEFCLNEMYVDTIGAVHISRTSIGSMFFAKNCTIDAAIKTYNKFRSAWQPHPITRMMDFGNPDTEPVVVEDAVAAV
jgi:hypothetical protein